MKPLSELVEAAQEGAMDAYTAIVREFQQSSSWDWKSMWLAIPRE